METTSRTLKQKAVEQMKEFLLIALCLWLVFGLLVVYRSVILAKYHIDFASHGFALFNALALGKIMLVAKDFHLGERFDDASAHLSGTAEVCALYRCAGLFRNFGRCRRWFLSGKVLRREPC
jgi:hypothetical protein